VCLNVQQQQQQSVNKACVKILSLC